MLITSNRQSVANLGTSVGVEVFTDEEAVAFLAERTGLADAGGSRRRWPRSWGICRWRWPRPRR